MFGQLLKILGYVYFQHLVALIVLNFICLRLLQLIFLEIITALFEGWSSKYPPSLLSGLSCEPSQLQLGRQRGLCFDAV